MDNFHSVLSHQRPIVMVEHKGRDVRTGLEAVRLEDALHLGLTVQDTFHHVLTALA